MRRRGFTLVELAVCLSLLGLVTPLIYAFGRSVEDRLSIGLWHLDVADGVRDVADALREDARGGTAVAGQGVGFVRGDCAVVYQVDDAEVLVRRSSCGGELGLSRGVSAMVWTAGGVALTHTFRQRPGATLQTVFFIPVDGAPAGVSP